VRVRVFCSFQRFIDRPSKWKMGNGSQAERRWEGWDPAREKSVRGGVDGGQGHSKSAVAK